MTTHHGRRRAFPELSFEVIEIGTDIDKNNQVFHYEKPVRKFPFTLQGYKKAEEAVDFATFGQTGQIAPRSVGRAYVLKNGQIVEEILGFGLVPDHKDGPQSQTALLAEWGRSIMDSK